MKTSKTHLKRALVTLLILLMNAGMPNLYAQNKGFLNGTLNFDDGIVYVTQTGAGTMNGTSWNNAMSNIQSALETATIHNCKVWIAKGTYYGDGIAEHNAFTMVDGVNVYGGFAGNEPADYDLSQRDFEVNVTILDGQNVQRVLYQENVFATYTTWDGFTIKNGYQYTEESNVSCYGAGVYLQGKVTLSNCKITENYACSKNYSVLGGALYALSSNYTRTINIIDCDISNNIIASDRTFSMWVAYCRYVNITNCRISNNPCYGEALSAYYSNVNNCVITDNGGTNYCTGVFSYGSTITNCLVSNNSSYGISCFDSNIYNCDILNNNYYGVIFDNTGTLQNCIVWGNIGYGQVYLPTYNGPNNTTVSYCAIEGGFEGEGNINLASNNDGTEALNYVRFVDVINNNFQLQDNSACVDTGDPGYLPSNTFDLAGNPRIVNGCIDIGCYEFSGETGVRENSQPSLVELYPNPTHDKLFVKASEPILLVEIYAATGNLKYKHANRCYTTEISVNNFAPGIYVIRMVTGTTTETKRFIVE